MATKLFICVKLLFLFFGIGLSSPSNPREVNLAIESSLFVNPQDVGDNSPLMDKVKQFIDKLQIPDQANTRKTAQKDILTDFLTELGILTINFDDDEFTKLAADLNDVVAIKSQTSEFNELFPDDIFKLFLKLTVTGWTKAEPTKLKLEIAKIVTNRETTEMVTFFRNLNKYFTESDEIKLNEIIEEFKKAKKEKKFSKVLKKTVDFIVFDKFEKADKETVDNFNSDVKNLIEHVKGRVKGNILSKIRTKDSFESFVEDVEKSKAGGEVLFEEVQGLFVRNDIKE